MPKAIRLFEVFVHNLAWQVLRGSFFKQSLIIGQPFATVSTEPIFYSYSNLLGLGGNSTDVSHWCTGIGHWLIVGVVTYYHSC